MVFLAKTSYSHFGNRRKQAADDDDDGDTTDVDDSEDVIVVPAGFVEAAEKLGLLSAPAASPGPREELQEPPSAPHTQLDEKPPTTERLSMPSSPPAVPEAIPSVPSPSSIQPPYEVLESVLTGVDNSDIQTTAATNSPTHLEPSKPSAPISVPQAASVPEPFQEAPWSFAPQYQNSTFWDNNMNDAQAFHCHQQDIQNALYLGPTSDDVDMEFSGATAIGRPVYSLPTMWTSPQPEHQMLYSHVDQVADNNNYYETYTMDNIHPSWASVVSIPIPISQPLKQYVERQRFQPVQNESVQQSAQINQPPVNHEVDPIAVASCFWTGLGLLSLLQAFRRA